MRKIITVLILLAILAGGLTACGSPLPTAGDVSPTVIPAQSADESIQESRAEESSNESASEETSEALNESNESESSAPEVQTFYKRVTAGTKIGDIVAYPEMYLYCDKPQTSVTAYDATGEKLTYMGAVVGTGMSVQVNHSEYVLIVAGDVNGDGAVNTTDYIQLRGILKNGISNKSFWYACDVNNDGEVNDADSDAIRELIANA